ncbi:AsmA-like C-terminal region-containing protein [Propionivibrio sp.]|uniref:AsmA-like C-terminal region-containing protein n=1 Tax=Propionivibrio sp. TaxID=2212460 RepID=UPI002620421E|nr:AsmA-like C-terminal region-containing protein [Propionivibrio sp.]
MDHDLIYTKTAAGEGAMLQRTRVMQRNVRMVLILVDSHSTVADLCLKTGNPQLTENALRELEKGGFIEPQGEPDSLWAESKKVAQEVRAAAILNKKKPPIAPAVTKDIVESSVPEIPMVSHSVIKTPPSNDSPKPLFSVASMQSEKVSVPQPPRVFAEEGAKKFTEQQSELPKASKPSFVQRVKAFFQRPGWSESEPIFVESLRPVPLAEGRREEELKRLFVERVKALHPSAREEAFLLKPIRRGQDDSMGWPVIVILSIAGVLALAFLVVLFFPYDSYLPKVEVAFASASGRPVHVGSMRVNVYPKPALLLGDVRIGSEKNAIRITEIRLQPVLDTLFSAKIVFREVVVSGVSLPAEMIAGLPSVFVALSSPTARAGMHHLSLEKAEVSFGGLGISGMNGEAKQSADGQFQSLLLRSADHSLSLVATPLEQGLDVVLEGLGWRPTPGSPFLFDSVNLKGTFEHEAFTIKSMELRLFEGVIEGDAVLRADNKPSITGDILFKRVNATRFADALGLGQQFFGETAGKMRFLTTSDSWASIFSAIDADGEFTVQRGGIRGIDLAEAARSVSKTPVQGGSTQFENLSGKIKLTPTGYKFSGLVLNSGLMQSTGFIDVGNELNVSGKMELKMRGTANQTRVTISISGPLKSPTLQVGGGG